MSFGDYSFAGGHVRLYKNWPKVYKKYNIIDTRHESKGGGGPQLGKTGPRREKYGQT